MKGMDTYMAGGRSGSASVRVLLGIGIVEVIRRVTRRATLFPCVNFNISVVMFQHLFDPEIAQAHAITASKPPVAFGYRRLPQSTARVNNCK